MSHAGFTLKLLAGLLTFASTLSHAVLFESEIKEMVSISEACAFKNDNSQYAIFHGCIDWHSAVHAHWASFRAALALGEDSANTARIAERLSVSGLEKEFQYVSQNSSFENPYGRSWFLRLAIDFEKWAERNSVPEVRRLRPLADLIAQSLLDYYRENEPTPRSPEYDNASWAFYQLRSYFDFQRREKELALVESIIEKKFTQNSESITFGQDKDDFFSLFGNWVYLVAEAATPEGLSGFLQYHPIDPRDVRPVKISSTAHSLGLNWSRAWALKALSQKVENANERELYNERFLSHVQYAMSYHSKYKNDYDAYSHWVPQFAIYALTE